MNNTPLKFKRSTIVLSILLLGTILFTSGCWGRRELTQMAIVSAVGLDKGENGKVLLSVQIINPAGIQQGNQQGGASPKGAFVLLQSEGETVMDAVRNLITKSGRKLYYPHNTAIVFGEELAREGLWPAIDLFTRDQEFRLSTWALVTKGKASEILKVTPKLEKIPARHLDLSLLDAKFHSKTVSVKMLELYSKLLKKNCHPVLGKVEVIRSNDNQELILNGAGVFRNDRLLGWLGPYETRGYLWIVNKVKSGVVVVPCPQNKARPVSLEIVKAKTKVKPDFTDGKISFLIKTEVIANMAERTCESEPVTAEMLDTLKEEFNQAVSSEIQLAVEKAQKDFELDFLGLGTVFDRKYPDEHKDLADHWDEEFIKAEVKTEVSSELRHIGVKR